MITDTTGVFKTKELPELEIGQSRYIMAAGGIYYEQKDDLFHGSDRVHEFYRDVNFGAMSLLPHPTFFIPQFPIIPAEMIGRCLGFFSRIEHDTGCECGLVLLFDPDTRQYQWCCPEQEINKWDLHFTTPIPGKDYAENLIHFGDVHLHPNMGAYHSGTDWNDEMTASDGLHLVVGTPKKYGKWNKDLKNGKGDWEEDTKEIEFCAVFVSDGARFKCDPASVMEITKEALPFPSSWLKKCKKEPEKKSWFGGGGRGAKEKGVDYVGY
jgi:hypothetical protein